MMLYHKPPQRTERMAKCMLEVAMRRPRRRACSEAKVTFVAMRSVGVVPGVKTDSHRLVRKSAMAGNVTVGWRGMNALAAFEMCTER